MYDRGKVLAGLFIFLVIVLFPVWFTAAAGHPKGRPEPVLPAEGTCVRETEWMRAHHMDLLSDWRDEVVREGKRELLTPDGRTIAKSLSRGCFAAACHGSVPREDFCERCHDYAGAAPGCFECHPEPGHVVPEGE